jgi:dCMP deaminase
MREDYISWDQYFMGISKLSGLRSKDPNTQVGACIVNPSNRIVGIGYNGFPSHLPDGDFPWGNDGEYLDTKYPYVVHAELNAILNARQNLEGCKLYVSLFPCNECAKAIIQSGISEIIYESDKYQGTDSNIASKRLLDAANIEYRQMDIIEITLK